MKTVVYILLLLGLLGCKKETQKKDNKQHNSKISLNKKSTQNLNGTIDLGDFVLYTNADTEDFKVSNFKNSDTIIIQKVLYKDLNNSVLKMKEGIKFKEIVEQVTFDFKQYTIDDNPATPLEIDIFKTNQTQNSNLYKLTNVSNYIAWLKNNYFNDVKTKSIRYQSKFYLKLLDNKEKYINCCPEYIKQAKDFVKSDKESFNDFEELNVSPYIKERFLKITFKKLQKTEVKYIQYYAYSN